MTMLSEDKIKSYLLFDPILRLCAGPEKCLQIEAMPLVFNFFRDNYLDHPHLPQSADPYTLQTKYLSAGSKKEQDFNRIVDFIYDRCKGLEKDQYIMMENLLKVDGSIILAYLLVFDFCSIKAYCHTWLASKCLILGFSDVSQAEYKKMLDKKIKEIERILR